MTSYLNRWSALAGWAAAMFVLWLVLVPARLSTSSMAILALAVPALAIGVATLRGAHAPAPSFGQARAQADAEERLPGRR